MGEIPTSLIFLVLLAAIAGPFWWKSLRQRRKAADSRTVSAGAGILEPVTLHPRIDILTCIGCGSCVRACPEDALGLVGGRAAIVNGARCVGHGLCVDACPVAAITLGFGRPRQGMEIPLYDDHFETNVPGLYIAGELGGIGLIKNAFEQGMAVIEAVSAQQRVAPGTGEVDCAIIGGGPAGIGAALAAQAAGLSYVVLEQYDLGGSILHYPRKKIVLTSPVELPLHGRLKASEISKEELLALFIGWREQYHLNVRTQEKVEAVERLGEGFIVRHTGGTTFSRSVLLALGRRGSPKKLGVPGEELPHVYYRLMEAESYSGKHLLVVGGGDSAIEAAVALARQRGNTVTLSYRREAFVRLKDANAKRIAENVKGGKVKVIFNSEVVEIASGTVAVREAPNIVHRLPNEAVFIFAGGELPSEFLKKIGVALRTREFEASAAAS